MLVYCFETSSDFPKHSSKYFLRNKGESIWSMSAHFHRIIHQRSQETCYNLERVTIVLMSKYILNNSSHVPGFRQTVATRYSRCSTLWLRSCLRAALSQSWPFHTSSLIALYRKVRRPCFEALWLLLRTRGL